MTFVGHILALRFSTESWISNWSQFLTLLDKRAEPRKKGTTKIFPRNLQRGLTMKGNWTTVIPFRTSNWAYASINHFLVGLLLTPPKDPTFFCTVGPLARVVCSPDRLRGRCQVSCVCTASVGQIINNLAYWCCTYAIRLLTKLVTRLM